MRTIYYSLKNLKLTVLVPLIVAWIIFPLFLNSSLEVITENVDKLATVGDNAQMLLPVMAIWLPVMTFRQYVEGDSSELLFFYQKTHLVDLFIYMVIYCAVAAVPFAFFAQSVNGIWQEYLRVVIQSVFFCSMSYFVSFVLRSTSMSLMLCLLIDFLFVMAKNYISSSQSVFSFGQPAFQEMFVLSKTEHIDKYWVLLIISACFVIFGAIAAKRRKK